MNSSGTVALSDFLDHMLTEKHGEGLTETSREQMKADLMPRLERWISVKTMEELGKQSPKDLQEFMTMMEEKKPMEEVQAFVDKTIPNYPAALAQILLEFRSLYTGASA